MSDLSEAVLERARARVGSSLRGKYLLESLLGVGGTAAVYVASHRNGMRTAVKVLHRELDHLSDVRTRFLREGYVANRIGHPGVVRVLDDDEDADGTAFIVMELLEGETVGASFARGVSWPVEGAIDLAADVLDVLDAAHAAGVVHRDVKPDNLFVTNRRETKLLDFGLARLVDASRATRSGQRMGSPGFVAPEQAAGRIREVGPASDIFSVGAVLYTMLSGHPIHAGRAPAERMMLAATRPVRPIREVAPGLPAALAEVVDVALAFDPSQRWRTAASMARSLRMLRKLAQTTNASSATPSNQASGLQRVTLPVGAPMAPEDDKTR
jgi:serine/threonine-protein kinase